MLHDKKIAAFLNKNIPLSALIEITRSCNMSCGFCYLGGKHNAEMKYESIFELLTELKRMGCMRVIFTGGEPLLHSDSFAIFREAKQMGFVCELNTNGTLICNENAEFLSNVFTDINISLHSSIETTHDNIMGVQGAWKRTIGGILLLKEHNAKITINSVITKFAVGEIKELANLVKNVLKCNWNPDSRIIPTYDGDNSGADLYSVPQEELQTVIDITQNYHQKNNTISTGICSAARRTVFIAADMKVYPCLQFKNYEKKIYTDNSAPSLMTQSLFNIWESDPLFLQIRRIDKEHFEKCMCCSYYKKCFKCIAENYSLSKNMTVPTEDICKREQYYALKPAGAEIL